MNQNKGRGTQSLGIRIAFSYSLFLLRSLIWQILLLSAVYWIFALSGAVSQARSAAQQYTPPLQRLPLVSDAPVSARQVISRTQEIHMLCRGRLVLRGTAVEWLTTDEAPPRLLSFAHPPLTLTVSGSSGSKSICVSYVLTDETALYFALTGGWILLEAVRCVILMRRGERISRRALRPITEIAETARKLSASNLSERIELHAAKTELKELSDVLNDMLDRIEAAYNTQKQFVSDASHELRTPIAVIQGYADMLDRWGKKDPEVCDESIAAIKSEAAGMKELIEQLLFIARHDNQTQQHEKIYFDAAELTEDVIKETRLIASKHTIRQGDIYRAILCGDRAALKQALRIFTDNAIKYTPEGGTITISCRKEEKLCRITVADTGIGIARQDLEHIFERFYRSDPARARRCDGHGLGLSIARLIVRAHGGRIEVQSKEGCGSRFHILLPL